MNSISPELMQALGLTVMDALWQGALILLLVLLFISIFKKSSPRLKYRLVVVAMLAMPIWSLISFNAHYTPHETLGVADSIFEGAPLVEGEVNFEVPVEQAQQPGIVSSILSWADRNANFAAYFWLLGVLVFGVRLAGGLFFVRFIKSRSKAVTDSLWLKRVQEIANDFHMKVKVGLTESAKVSSPIVVGVFKPVIIFPIGLIAGLPTPQVEAILAHELAHIKRMDFLVNLLLSLLQVVYFFHPAYWWLYRQAEQEREYHCDALAIHYIGDKITLIKALTAVQELKRPGLVPAIAFARKKNQLLERIVRIAEDKPKTNWLSGLVSLVLILISFAMISWQNKPAMALNPDLPLEDLTESVDGVDLEEAPIELNTLTPVQDTIPKTRQQLDRDYEATLQLFESSLKYWEEKGKEEDVNKTRSLIAHAKRVYEGDSLKYDQRKINALRTLLDEFVQETSFGDLGRKVIQGWKNKDRAFEERESRLREAQQQYMDYLNKLQEQSDNYWKRYDSLASTGNEEAWKKEVQQLRELYEDGLATFEKLMHQTESQRRMSQEELEKAARQDATNAYQETLKFYEALVSQLKQNTASMRAELEQLLLNVNKIKRDERNPFEVYKGYLEAMEALVETAASQEAKDRKRLEMEATKLIDEYSKYADLLNKLRMEEAFRKVIEFSDIYDTGKERVAEVIEPYQYKVYTGNYEVMRFAVTEETLKHGDYGFDFKEERLDGALIELNGKVLGSNPIIELKEIPIVELASIEEIRGALAIELYPTLMKNRDPLIRVMTKEYAASAEGARKIEEIMHTRELREAVERGDQEVIRRTLESENEIDAVRKEVRVSDGIVVEMDKDDLLEEGWKTIELSQKELRINGVKQKKKIHKKYLKLYEELAGEPLGKEKVFELSA